MTPRARSAASASCCSASNCDARRERFLDQLLFTAEVVIQQRDMGLPPATQSSGASAA